MVTALNNITRSTNNMKLRIFLIIAIVTIISWNRSNAQNTCYYDIYKHWSPELETLAAEGNNAMAIVSLGSCYDRADGVAHDTSKAFILFKKAANLGDILALYNLGFYYYKGIATEIDYVEAEKNFLKAIEKQPDFMPAYQCLAHIYENGGYGININHSKAFQMYSKASDLGDPISTFNMGSYYKRGLVTGKPDFSKSLEYFFKVKEYWEANIKPAGLVAQQIANCYLNGDKIDLEKAISYSIEAIELGYFESYLNLATAYNLKGDFKKSYQALHSGYEKGIMSVCNNLGDAYYNGIGTSQSYEKAYDVFKKGAETSPICKFRQSEMLRKGEGVAKNYEMAYKLLEECAASGCGIAQYRLGCDLYDGTLVHHNYARAVELFKQALHGKDMINDEIRSDICRRLAICYRFGKGVEVNWEQANEYNHMSATFGESNAAKHDDNNQKNPYITHKHKKD